MSGSSHNVNYRFTGNFGDLTWSEIHNICAINKHQQLFSVGDYKTDNGVNYTIIGFERDNAPLTLFTNGSLGNVSVSSKSNHENILETIDSTGYSNMPSGLKPYVKQTTRYFATSEQPGSTQSTFRLFALSGREIGVKTYWAERGHIGGIDYSKFGTYYPYFTSQSKRIVSGGVTWPIREPETISSIAGVGAQGIYVIDSSGSLNQDTPTSNIAIVGAFAFE